MAPQLVADPEQRKKRVSRSLRGRDSTGGRKTARLCASGVVLQASWVPGSSKSRGAGGGDSSAGHALTNRAQSHEVSAHPAEPGVVHQQPQTQRGDEPEPGPLQGALSGAGDGVGDKAIMYVGAVPPGGRHRTGGRHIYSTAQAGTKAHRPWGPGSWAGCMGGDPCFRAY